MNNSRMFVLFILKLKGTEAPLQYDLLKISALIEEVKLQFFTILE